MQATTPADIATIVSALQQGRMQEAEQMTRARLVFEPGNEDALMLLAMCLQLQERNADAVHAWRELTVRMPQSAVHWNNLATALRNAGELLEAEDAYRRTIELDPDSFLARLNLGYLLLECGKFPEARDCFLAAHTLDPASPEARIFAAQMCIALDERDLAKRLLEPRGSWTGLPDDLTLELASLMSSVGTADEGLRLFEELLRHDPHNLRAMAQLVVLYERINRLDEARTMLARLPPPESVDDAKLRYDLIGAQATFALRDKDPANAAALLERLITAFADSSDAQFKPWRADHLYFSLAKVRDRQGDTEGAMAALAEAHSRQMLLARQAVPELAKPDAEPLFSATKWIDAPTRASWPDYPAPSMLESPIFVVGFPRSGTTMLEQMLDAHPSLQSMDERAFLQDLIGEMSPFGYEYPYDLGKLSAAQCEELRRVYWKASAQVAPRKEGQRLVDKNPLHMLRLPLIARLFPNAPIILALRHPCDVILSNYMQNFSAKPFTVLCSSLERLAQGYVNAMDSWIYHAGLLKPLLIHSRYEDLLDDFAGNTRRIADYLGLDDASPMRRFDQHARDKGFISTPSYTGVIEPPNKKAVDRWRRYHKWFEPILPTLQPIMQHWGYHA
jgi:tetratricopeptide (TPR) repeat protein